MLYRGERIRFDIEVYTFDGWKQRPLRKYLHELNHSPTGFNWGYGGSGPAQLAYAILRQYFSGLYHEDVAQEKAKKYYQAFKNQVISGIDSDRWHLTDEDIKKWLENYRNSED